jgi:hypothetical protein
MNALVLRAAERHITAPLIGNDPVVHDATNNTQHIVVKEEIRSKAWWLKRHGEKVAIRASGRLLAVGLEMRKENRPKRASAGIDQGPRKMFPEYAIAPVLNLDDLVLDACQSSFPMCHQSGRPLLLKQLQRRKVRRWVSTATKTIETAYPQSRRPHAVCTCLTSGRTHDTVKEGG